MSFGTHSQSRSVQCMMGLYPALLELERFFIFIKKFVLLAVFFLIKKRTKLHNYIKSWLFLNSCHMYGFITYTQDTCACEQIYSKNTPETSSVHVNKKSSLCSVQCVHACSVTLRCVIEWTILTCTHHRLFFLFLFF